MIRSWALLSCAAVLALAACETLTEPGILALPGSGKSLEQFQADDLECRGYASGRVNAAAAGAGASYDVQRRYDFPYVQCMYARGHKVPVSGGYTSTPTGVGPPPPGAPPADAFIAPPPARSSPPPAEAKPGPKE